MTAADKAQVANHLATEWQDIFSIHRATFPLAVRPVPEPKQPIDADAIRKAHRTAAKKDAPWYQRSARRVALEGAAKSADDEIRTEQERMDAEYAQYLADLSDWWRRLEELDPALVLHRLEDAFEDNQAPAVAVGVDDGEVSLLVMVPQPSALPDRIPGVTAAGNVSLRKPNKSETADFYKILVTAHMIVTVKEAFAVVPRLKGARIVAVRESEPDAWGKTHGEALAWGKVARTAFDGVDWQNADAVRVYNDCFSERLSNQGGRTDEFRPMDLSTEPDIAALLDAMDLNAKVD